ncbi:hypothetical protein GCM10022407_15500 [Hymenobacter antarcticus]|uniref:Fibronectin type-III domain-containing protein n=1 Tax=Hymenobacter antarcticus TaxID=486270 RepID=A0ABP7PU91_9BACT
MLVAGLLPLGSRAQLVANYAFAASTGTFTELTGATLTPGLRVDTGNTPAIPLGFTFRFEGVDYTSVIATSDGYLTFNSSLTSSTFNNGFAFVTLASDPLIAGLWDDLTGAVASSRAGYAMTGAPGSRVFTFEWLNWGWNYNATAGGVSFQIKLREGSNQVELVYRPEAGAVVSGSASVGLRSAGGQGAGTYLSVNSLSTTATTSSTVATDNLATKPASGLTFTFTPAPCNAPPTYATLPVSQSFEAAWTDACATRNAAGPSWRTTPLIGDNSWRRDDDGAAAAWRSPTSYLPTPRASQGSRAAIFHSAFARAGSLGSLDLYVDLSAGGTKTLSFDYVNPTTVTGGNPEKLEVLLSTDGGATFGAPLLTLTVAAAYTPQSVTVPGTSATSVIRFRGTGEFGNSDIGIDNVRVIAAACAPPTAPAVSTITSISASLSFTASATASSYTVSYQPAGGATQTVSAAASPVALTGLTPATIYTVTAVSSCGAGATSPTTPSITFTTAPVNDLCPNAQTLTPATPCAGTAGTVGGATGSGPAGTTGGTADDDVWYSFVATSPQHRITVTENVYTNATDLSHEVFGGGSCPGASATPLFSSFQPTILATGLTVGQTYFVRVFSYYAVPLTPLEGAFTICVDRPSNVPANDECAAAVSLTQATNATCTATGGTVFGATQSAVSGGSTGTADDDVWYSFVATSAAAAVALTNTGSLDVVVNLRTGPCATGTSLRFGDQAGATAGAIDSVIVRNLTAGQTYYVRVYSYGTTPATVANGTFTLCVTTPPALPITCAPPTALMASGITTTTAILGWTPGASGTSYLIEYGPSGFAPGSGTGFNVLAPASSATIIGLTPATAYQFYMTQQCASGQTSPRVGPVSFSTLGAPATCAPPTGLTTGNVSSTGATISWTPGASAATYAVEYGLSGFTPGSAGGTVSAGLTAATLNLTGLTPATTYQCYVTQTCASGQSSARVGPVSFTTLGAALNNLVVSTTQGVQGTYDNVTITGTGAATLGGALVVNQSLTVLSGGLLNSNCQLITGPGSFTLSAGGTLNICDPAGIAQTGATGTVRVAGPRTFSTGGLYVYDGPAPSARATGPGLPAEVRELTVNLPADLSLTNGGLDIAQVLRLTSANLSVPAGTRLRLLSGPGGTALVVNTGGGISGPGAGAAQVQRYVSASLNAGPGYRHFSAPVGGAALSQLGSGGSAVVINVAFNAASATVRPTIVPFPTVFFYDQSQVPATGSLLAFDQGWTSPTAASSVMGTGQGFTMQASGAETITFQGLLTTGAVQLPGLGFGPNAGQAGWQLLGNPYPSPLDWSTLTVGTLGTDNLQNLNGAVYVFQSSGPYAGTYRSYIGGIGNPLVASGQGFFVRTAGSGQSGTLRLGNANRVTTWSATNSTLNRSTADTRPQVHLRLSSPAAGLAPDVAVVYFEAGATAGIDARFDAYKLRNPGAAVSLFSLAGPEELSINGLPLPAGLPLTLPLGLSVPQAGTYTFEADQLLNFRAGDVQLRDALTGALVDLSQQPTYAFQVAAGSLSSTTRFALLFRPGTVTATAPVLSAAQVGLFPNPARQEFTLTMPGLPAARTVVAELSNALGQRVLVQTLALPGTGLRARFDVRALPTGVYSLRLKAGSEPPLTKRLIIE